MEETSEQPALTSTPVTTPNLCTNLLYPLMLELIAIDIKDIPSHSEPFPSSFHYIQKCQICSQQTS